MSTWARVEDPRARRKRSWVLDVLVALVVTGIGVVGAIAASSANVVVGGLVGFGLGALLLVRRIWPSQVFAAQWGLAALLGWWAGDNVVSPALLVGLYTVAALKSRRDALVAAGFLELGVVVAAVHLYNTDGQWWAVAIAFTAVLVASLAVGLYVGTRRTLLAELRARADRLERERDQQAAIASAAERARIAREMHDIVAHHLTVMVALSDGAVAASARNPDQAAEAMRTVSATGREALSDTRRLLGVLRDDTADGDERRPLPDLSDLDELLHRVRDAGLPVRYEVHGMTPEVPPAVQLTVYRLVQEALTNTMKHAGQGASASVSLHYAPDAVSVDVRDDGGSHLPTPSTQGAGRGLAGMRERVSAFGGEVWTGPVDGRGWRVAATMRLQEVS
ncbi:sensor histidine kinase [Jatrophihabitans sp. YIM 134969]